MSFVPERPMDIMFLLKASISTILKKLSNIYNAEDIITHADYLTIKILLI